MSVPVPLEGATLLLLVSSSSDETLHQIDQLTQQHIPTPMNTAKPSVSPIIAFSVNSAILNKLFIVKVLNSALQPQSPECSAVIYRIKSVASAISKSHFWKYFYFPHIFDDMDVLLPNGPMCSTVTCGANNDLSVQNKTSVRCIQTWTDIDFK